MRESAKLVPVFVKHPLNCQSWISALFVKQRNSDKTFSTKIYDFKGLFIMMEWPDWPNPKSRLCPFFICQILVW